MAAASCELRSCGCATPKIVYNLFGATKLCILFYTKFPNLDVLRLKHS